MASEGRRTLSRVYSRLFPERQIYLRTRGEVRFVSLSSPVQAGIVGVLLLLTGWIGFASFQFAFQNDIIAAKNARLRTAEAAYQALEAELRQTKVQFIAAARDLDTKHNQLVALVTHKDELEQRLADISNQLAKVTSEHRDASDEAAQLRDDLEGQRRALTRELETQRSALTDRIGDLQGTLQVTMNQRSMLEENLRATQSRVAFLNAERDSLIRSNGELSSDLNAVKLRLTAIREEQQTFVDRVVARTNDDITTLHETIAMTGIAPDDLYERVGNGPTGMGGPVLAPDTDAGLTTLTSLQGDEFESAVHDLEDRLQRWEALQNVLRVLPLAAPADNFYISSGFGRRRDPMTNDWAYHSGVDLAGPPHQPVFATAPGEVVFAGRNGPYGKMVEIDHGYGMRTRYGHLDKILVEKGQVVGFREAIGKMGSTGRSTGTHLHYEIRFDGKAYDPSRFLKAGKYVFKN